jgi:hypothetical protein
MAEMEARYHHLAIPTQTLELGEAMKVIGLLCTFVLARICMLVGREVPLSFWTPIAYLWQDLLIVVLFTGLDLLARRRSWMGWTVYWGIVLYLALNVPIARVLWTPLTWPLLRAAGAPLADSITYYVTWGNLFLMVLVITTAIGFPFLFRRVPTEHTAVGGLVVLPLILLGPLATTRVETLGLHRNVLIALVTTAFPRVTAERAVDSQWTNPTPGTVTDDLSRYRNAASGRNVVVVILESAAAQYLRPYGAIEDPMPNFTELAEQGILFENMYIVYPESIKGLFAMLCSNYPALDTEPKHYEKITIPSLATILRERNYHTALFHSGRFRYLGMESIIRNRGYQVLEDAGHIGGNHNSSFGIDEPSTVRRILAWIDSLPRGERFFITYMPIAGHHPYETPEPGPFPEDQPIGRYRNALYYADTSLGDLIRGLRARDLDQNTLLVVLGDHGQAFGQHPGNYGHNLFLYEENVRVPFVVVAPEAIKEPVRLKRVASLIDLAPTVLDLLGLSVPESYQGQSLLDNQSRMALFFTDYSLSLLGLRDGNWKFIFETEGSSAKLFNLREDPTEQHNIAEQFPEQIAKYRELLLHWAADQRHRVIGGS